jgi:hypothetical protein
MLIRCHGSADLLWSSEGILFELAKVKVEKERRLDEPAAGLRLCFSNFTSLFITS